MQVGVLKTESLHSACAALNSSNTVIQHNEKLRPDNAVTLCAAYDVVADCSDNPATRYLVNDACMATGTPLVSGAAVGTDGQLSVYGYLGGPCYRCACSQGCLLVCIISNTNRH
jgi:adenylyltransferase and sulfurtransferase